MRVSVATAQKPAPKATFKYLRRDEGRLSYSASSPMRSSSATTTPTTGSKVAPRRDSQALRDAIATDMRQGRSHDPLGEVIVALPKRAPPPSSEGAVGESAAIGSSSSVEDGGPRRSSSAAAPASTTAKTPRRGGTPTATRRRPEWVDPVVFPNQGEPAPLGRPVRRSPSGGNVHHEDMTGGRGPSNGREEHSFDATPHGAHNDASASAQIARRPSSAPRRYGQGATSFEEDYRQRERQPSTNFFGRPTTREYRRPSHGVEDELLLQLQEEVEAAQEERSRYTRYKQQLERERQRFEDYKHEALLKLDEERADLEAYRVSEHRSAQQDIHSMEDRYRKVSALLATERENSRHVMAEADGLRAQLDNLTRAMREAQFNHKSEVQRLRRDVESLSRRNAELLTMAKEQQMGALGSAAAAADSASTRSSKPRGAYLDDSPSASRQRVTAPTTSPPREALVEESPSNPRSANSRRETSMPNLSDMSSQKGGAADGSEAGEVKEQSGVLEAKPYHSMIIDFTPLSTTSEHAKEKRAKQMEERMKREDAAMQQRRQQRERETMERREKEVAEQAQREAEERQRREEQAAAAPKSSTKKEKTAATPTNTNGSSVSRKRSDDKAEEVSNERKSSGHPVRTPRVGGSAKSPKKAAASKKTSSSATTSSTSPAALPSRPSVHIPSREELIGCTEGIPEETYPNDAVVSQTAIGDNPNKREELYRSGKREIHYANGTVKAVLPSGHTVLHFTNGDVKCTFPSGKSTYWYAAAKTTHSQLPDGVQVFEFHTTGQTERHFSDGVKHILYPDGLFKVHHADGTDETFLPENHTSNTNGAS